MIDLKVMSKEQLEKFQRKAMSELVPQAALNFRRLPLTLAGKIFLSQFSNEAIKHSEWRFNQKLVSRGDAFRDLCRVATNFCNEYGIPLKVKAVEILKLLFGVKLTDDYVEPDPMRKEPLNNVRRRPELDEYVVKDVKGNDEDLNISYFRLQDSIKGVKFLLSNPYEKRMRESLQEAIKDTDLTEEKLKEKLYKIYLQKKA